MVSLTCRQAAGSPGEIALRGLQQRLDERHGNELIVLGPQLVKGKAVWLTKT